MSEPGVNFTLCSVSCLLKKKKKKKEEEEEEEEANLSIYVPHRSIPFPYIIVTRMPVDLI